MVRAVKEAEKRAFANVTLALQEEIETGVLKNLHNLQLLANGISKEASAAYGIPPDRYSNIYLIDRYLGKPTERTEGRQEIVVRVVYGGRPQVIEGVVIEEKT